MKVSIITVCYNSEATIRDTIESVLTQSYSDIEYIIIDGASSDRTMIIVDQYKDRIAKVVHEPDGGIYDAMNKGIKLATGDVVGILNSDDFYYDKFVLEKVLAIFLDKKIDAIFADLVYLQPGKLDSVVRYYSGAGFTLKRFAYGWMPPHPTFFLKRELYEKYGFFKTYYKIAADFELLVRFLARHQISYYYLPEVIVNMRTGGLSTRNLKSNWILNKEIIRACKENNINTNVFKVYSKYLTKVLQLVRKH